jgi:hypothetical protein
MLSPLFSVVDPASPLDLLSQTELRLSVGLASTNASQDPLLSVLSGYVSDAITQACRVATDGATPPTLLEETVSDMYRLNRWFGRRERGGRLSELILSRRPIVSVISVVEAGVTLDPSCYDVFPGAGILLRLLNGYPSWWVPEQVIVSYVAGFATIPQALKRAANKMMRLYWYENTRDPLLKSISVPNVIEKTFWIGGTADPALPQDVMDDLAPFLNPCMG